MTTAVKPPEPAAYRDRELRAVSIAADLLPVEIVESRQGRRIRRVVISAACGVVVVLAAWYGMSVLQTGNARDDLAGAQADVTNLTLQQQKFSTLVGTQAQAQAIEGQLRLLFGNDLQWSTLVTGIAQAVPSGMSLTNVSGSLPDTNGAVTGKKPTLSGTDQIGMITIAGAGQSRTQVSAYIDALAKVPGLGSPLLTSMTVKDGAVQFTVQLDITKSALGGRYTPQSAAPSAVKR